MGRRKGMGRATYVVYRGDDVLGVGTADELGERLGVRPDTIRWMASPTAHKRDNGCHMVAERIDG